MKRAAFPLLGIIFSALLFLPIVRAAEGEISRTVTETSDYFVVVNEPLLFTARTLLCDDPAVLWCSPPPAGHFMDSALWLYDTTGLMLASSDDNGVSWASLIQISLEPGVYRLRAGRYGPCNSTGCMHPEEPFPVGGSYELLTNLPLVLDPTPPVASPPPIPSELPSEEPSVEPSPSPTPEPSPSIEPSIEPTPTPEPTPSEEPSIEPTPTPEPTPTATPEPTATPQPSPVPTPTASPTPDPTPVPTPEPTQSPLPSVEPSVEPTPEPTAPPSIIDETVAEIAAAVSSAVDATIGRVANLGKDLSPAEKEKAAPVAVAIVISQVASAAVAAAATASRKVSK